MKQKLFLVSTLFLVLFSQQSQAQQATTVSGGIASGSGGTSSYSVGQVVYTTSTGTNGSMAQGVEQAYEISIVLGVEEEQISLNMMVYPNPTTDYLTLTIGNIELSGLSFGLYESNGRLIESKKITSTSEMIRMEHLPSAIYFLKVIQNNNELKTFKIIKK
jgi:hypothetical protein